MELCSIASGSSGNCIYVGTQATHLLVDVGISGKRTESGLNSIGLSGRDLDGILITHEHSDHVSGLGVMSRKYHIPIYATAGTIEAIRRSSSLGKIDEELFVPIEADSTFTLKDILVSPMSTSHDAIQPVAYRFRHGKQKIAIATDLGTYNDYTVECLKGMDLLFLEANHDVNMLQVGPYPYALKQRILGDRGHLSNERSGQLLEKLLHDKLQAVVLGHLSKENNLPQLAYETVRVELAMGKTGYRGDEFPITVAKRDEVSDKICIA
ncbi:MAG: MBL fold metallo-hydrolase [Lachnospiraceae bacterium]